MKDALIDTHHRCRAMEFAAGSHKSDKSSFVFQARLEPFDKWLPDHGE